MAPYLGPRRGKHGVVGSSEEGKIAKFTRQGS